MSGDVHDTHAGDALPQLERYRLAHDRKSLVVNRESGYLAQAHAATTEERKNDGNPFCFHTMPPVSGKICIDSIGFLKRQEVPYDYQVRAAVWAGLNVWDPCGRRSCGRHEKLGRPLCLPVNGVIIDV
jgi:hypothetical protein